MDNTCQKFFKIATISGKIPKLVKKNWVVVIENIV